MILIHVRCGCHGTVHVFERPCLSSLQLVLTLRTTIASTAYILSCVAYSRGHGNSREHSAKYRIALLVAILTTSRCNGSVRLIVNGNIGVDWVVDAYLHIHSLLSVLSGRVTTQCSPHLWSEVCDVQ